MSEPREVVVDDPGVIGEDAETELEEDLETEDPEEDPDEDGERKAKPAVDWEKRAHDKEGAMAKERSRRRAAERQVSELNARLDRLEGAQKKPTVSRREQLIGQLRDDTEDPLNDLEAVKQIARTLLEEQREEAEQQAEAQAQQNKINLLTTSMNEFEADFRDDHKDYDEACNFFKNHRAKELERMGYIGDRLVRRLSADVYGMVEETIRAGRDPAEAVYDMAKARGFKAGTDEATKKLQKLQNGARATVGARGSQTGTGRVTYEQVTRAKGSDRDKLWAALRKQEMGVKT